MQRQEAPAADTAAVVSARDRPATVTELAETGQQKLSAPIH
jgi:hypothetical protein